VELKLPLVRVDQLLERVLVARAGAAEERSAHGRALLV
jgi:hypothetical protein